MKIGIIGGGAIGLLLAAYYSKEHEVIVFTRTIEQAAEIAGQGIRLLTGEKERIAAVRSSVLEGGFPEKMDFLFAAVKQYDMAPVIHELREAPDSALCFVQNGMGHLMYIDSLPHTAVAVATIEHGAERIDGRTVRHNGIGKMNVAPYRGGMRLEAYFPRVDCAEFPFAFHQDAEKMLLGKLLANAVINPLTAALKVRNGQLLSNPDYFLLFNSLYEEVSSVFPLLAHPRYYDEIVGICRNTQENTSSMLKDLLAGRKTEADAILGFIIEEAEKREKEIPSVRFVYRMIKGMEAGGEVAGR